jgi:formylmethanofuran dehydrogenase subunit E
VIERDDLSEDLRSAIDFHGHLCPGFLIGYRAVRAAMERGIVARAEDEEIVAQVENDSCSVDAVQFLAGCTFGKGNLIFKDYGKQGFTFWNRSLGVGMRIALKAPLTGLLTEEESAGDTEEVRESLCRLLLEGEENDLFNVTPVEDPPPAHARIFSSIRCEGCGEPTMETRARIEGGETLCIPCFQSRVE